MRYIIFVLLTSLAMSSGATSEAETISWEALCKKARIIDEGLYSNSNQHQALVQNPGTLLNQGDILFYYSNAYNGMFTVIDIYNYYIYRNSRQKNHIIPISYNNNIIIIQKNIYNREIDFNNSYFILYINKIDGAIKSLGKLDSTVLGKFSPTSSVYNYFHVGGPEGNSNAALGYTVIKDIFLTTDKTEMTVYRVQGTKLIKQGIFPSIFELCLPDLPSTGGYQFEFCYDGIFYTKDIQTGNTTRLGIITGEEWHDNSYFAYKDSSGKEWYFDTIRRKAYALPEGAWGKFDTDGSLYGVFDYQTSYEKNYIDSSTPDVDRETIKCYAIDSISGKHAILFTITNVKNMLENYYVQDGKIYISMSGLGLVFNIRTRKVEEVYKGPSEKGRIPDVVYLIPFAGKTYAYVGESLRYQR